MELKRLEGGGSSSHTNLLNVSAMLGAGDLKVNLRAGPQGGSAGLGRCRRKAEEGFLTQAWRAKARLPGRTLYALDPGE